jgi:predicted dienelactone hydrolase
MFVGSLSLTITDHDNNVTFPSLLFYPTETPSSPVAFGPYSMELALNAPIQGEHLPLVVISHGSGSTPLVYRTLAIYLAKHGFVVALPEHPGNNRSNNSLDGTVTNLQHRPRHLRQTIDAVLADSRLTPHVEPHHVAVIGHSLGAYTALAVAGGQPWAGLGQKIEVSPDPRVQALVLMAPVSGFFVPNDALRNVHVPILMFGAAEDRITPKWQTQLILDLLPGRDQVIFHSIAHAGHYSFLSPFPAAMKRPDFPPSQDPPGFDRERFHDSLNETIRSFLHTQLGS